MVIGHPPWSDRLAAEWSDKSDLQTLASRAYSPWLYRWRGYSKWYQDVSAERQVQFWQSRVIES